MADVGKRVARRRRCAARPLPTLEDVAEPFFFENFLGITLTTQDEADIVAFLKLL